MRAVITDAKRLDNHLTHEDIPNWCQDHRRFGFTRNPWDWYVSWYHYQFMTNQSVENPVTTALKSMGIVRFDSVTMELLNPSAKLKLKVLKLCSSAISYSSEMRGMNLRLSSQWLDADESYMSFLERIYNDECLQIIKLEEIAIGLEDALGQVGDLTMERQTSIRFSSPINTSPRGDYRQYYSDELRDLVLDKEGRRARQYGYRFD